MGDPEQFEDGCSYRRFDDRFDRCASCPMPLGCRYELEPRAGLLLALTVATLRLVREGLPLAAIAERLNAEPGAVTRIARVLLAATGDLDGAVAGLTTRDQIDSFDSTDTFTIATMVGHPAFRAALRGSA